MKSINVQLKGFFVLVFFFFLGVSYMSAQSTVIFFTPSTSSNECVLKMNGNVIGELRGPLKKTTEHSMFKIPYKTYEAAYKKCVIKEEGKVLFAVDYTFTNCTTLAVSEIPSEIQLNLSEGSVHYVRLAPKGVSNLEFKEITEKEAQKLLKKATALPEYTQE
jgi:hypothetical protein